MALFFLKYILGILVKLKFHFDNYCSSLVMVLLTWIEFNIFDDGSAFDLLGSVYSALDFELRLVDGFGLSFVAILGGLITGFLYPGAGKNAPAFWLGTDHIRCNLPIISCGWFSHIVFYANYRTLAFTSMLWIKPFDVFFVNKNTSNAGHREKLVGNMGMSETDFVNFRLLCFLFSGFLQVVYLRSNVQTS